MQKLPSNKKIATPAVTFNEVGVFYKKHSKNLIKNILNGPKGHWAIENVSFEINKGDVLGIVGNNGAGKSTTLLLIGEVISSDRGTVNTYNNKAMLLTINTGIMKNLSGRKNIMLLGLAIGIERKKIIASMDKIIEFSELEKFIDDPVETYSSGMQSRLGFSTALMLTPDILLVDEVLGVGDRDFKKKSTDALKEKIQHSDSTAIITSHDRETILELCNKALWIDKGKSIVFGDPEDVIKSYENSSKTI
ncbi:MAG TPA: ABC transporter ATP-binding protein [Oligoflexia bacterium]|nr:ABC transporter ATP-binding protein [Oligoflexia bacterium]HMR23805.1 ABC transporter ATP-binding protein [Oligoflexia bacterium]